VVGELRPLEVALGERRCRLAFASAHPRAVEQVTEGCPSLTCCPGVLETRFYAAVGIPAVAFGLG
jgi:hypothetical protein